MAKKNFFMVSDKAWDRYKKIVNNFLNLDSGRQKITWYKHLDEMLSHGEDSVPQYFGYTIEALCYYNSFRNWPINQATLSGQVDEENLSILISKDYLAGRGFLNRNGYWEFDWAADRFIINGVCYRPDGDTQVAQAKDEALVFQVILRRDRDAKINSRNIANGFLDKNGNFFCDKNSEPLLGKL